MPTLLLSTTLWYYHTVEFIESRPFTRRLHELAGDAADELLRAIQAQLDQKPDRGPMVAGLGGVRKVRVPGRGKGKRGGFRCLYLYLEKRQHVHLLILLAKNEQEDATTEQRSLIRRWVAEIKKVSGG
ncbi:MAG: toxin HigB-2 [Acidobacteria bacterium]|nr:MAG: toxin HigB-2 [Acidobacteriota bacterium]